MQHFQIVFEQQRLTVKRYTKTETERKAYRTHEGRETDRESQGEKIRKPTPFKLT